MIYWSRSLALFLFEGQSQLIIRCFIAFVRIFAEFTLAFYCFTFRSNLFGICFILEIFELLQKNYLPVLEVFDDFGLSLFEKEILSVLLLNLRPEFLILLQFLLVFSFDNSNPIFQAIDNSAVLIKLLVLGMEEEFVGILQLRYLMSIRSTLETSLFCECSRGMAKNIGISRLNEIVWLRSGSIFWVRDFSESLLVGLFRPVSTSFDIMCIVLFIVMISFVLAMGVFLADLLLAVNLLHFIKVWMGFGSVSDASFFFTVFLRYGF